MEEVKKVASLTKWQAALCYGFEDCQECDAP